MKWLTQLLNWASAAAVPIAGFFRNNAVAGVVAAMGVTFVTTRHQVIPRSLQQRELQLRTPG